MLDNQNPPRFSRKPKSLLIIILCLGMVTFSSCQVNQPEVNTAIDVSPILITPELTEVTATIQVIDQPGNPQDTQPAVSITATSGLLEPSAAATDFPEDFWKELPIFPESISDKMREVYEKGLEMGNDPQSFIRVGDCNSKNPDFLAGFDGKYNLGEYTYLQPTIDYFKGSFGRYNQTANPGNTTSRVVVSFWNNGDCLANEPMLECQFRLDNPSIAFISLGTIDAKYDYKYPTSFERNLRRIIEKTLENGIIPILVTKADNLEGDYSINATIARLALEYEVPLWNFWRSTQALEHVGLLPDMEHLNFLAGPPSTDFSSPYSLYYAKEVRNLNGLQMLNFLLEELGIFEKATTPTVIP